MRFSTLLAIELVCTLTAGTVIAKPKARPAPVEKAAPAEKADPAKAEAKLLTQAANQDYTLGRFEEALEKYSRAYEKFHAPELLFNIGQCHKNLHRNERAIFFFQGYLRAKPDAANAKLAEGMINELQAELDREEAEKKRRERAERQRQEKQRAAQTASAPLPGLQPANALQQSPPPVYKKGWFWGVLIGGVAAAAAATTLAIVFTQTPEQRATLGNVDLR